MGNLVAIDYGIKRTGLAHTDSGKIIASGLTSLTTDKVLGYLKAYCEMEDVDTFVIGQPRQKDGNFAAVEEDILKFITDLKKIFPNIAVERYDERFTSKIAFQTMIDAGLKQKKRRDKGLVDQISATLILQSYLDFKAHQL